MTKYSDATKRFLLAAKQAKKDALHQLAENCRLVTLVSNLIHNLQKERGISNIYLASQGTRFAEKRAEQVKSSVLTQLQLEVQLKKLLVQKQQHSQGNMRLLSRISLALQLIDQLEHKRLKIADLSSSTMESTQAFCRLISRLLDVIFEAVDVANNGKISTLLVALFNFIQGKEFAGQERAFGAIGFAQSAFEHSLCERLLQLCQSQQHSFSLFLQFATTTSKQLWHQLEQSSQSKELSKLRLMIQQLANGTPISDELSEVWYRITTSRIDQMHQIEKSLTASLLESANQLEQQAESQLKDPFNTPDIEDEKLTSLSMDSLEVQRSFYDLLKEQAEQICHISQELEEAKLAIADQKTINRAKLLIMQHYKTTEDESYHQLQKLAMNNGSRLIDIAGKVIKELSKSQFS